MNINMCGCHEGKAWGSTNQIFSNNSTAVHRITGKLGGICSTHKHTTKFSMFFVEKGIVKISIEKNDYALTDVTTLAAGQSTIIKPGEFHWFEIMEEGAVCYEIYWVGDLDQNDIIRKSCGSAPTILK